MKDIDLAWLAGFMEGEGTFSIYHQKRKGKNTDQLRADISVANTDIALIQNAKEIFETMSCSMRIRGPYKKKKSTKEYYELSTANAMYIKRICLDLIPFLRGEKLAKAKLLLSFVDNRLARRESEYNGKYDDKDWKAFKNFRSSETTREAA